MNKEFSSSGDYIEYGVCLEKFYIHKPCYKKFYIPALMSMFIDGDEPKELEENIDNSHLINKDKASIEGGTLTKCNYIEIYLPEWITAPIRDIEIHILAPLIISDPLGGTNYPDESGGYIYPDRPPYPGLPDRVQCERIRKYFYDIDEYERVSKGKEFSIGFVGGDYKYPYIIGRFR